MTLYHILFPFVLPFHANYSKVFDEHTVYPVNESLAIMTHAKFDHKKKTVLYIHGYVEDPTHQSIHVIVDAYLQRDDYNIMVLDWSDLADGNFFVDAVPNIKQVSCSIRILLFSTFFLFGLHHFCILCFFPIFLRISTKLFSIFLIILVDAVGSKNGRSNFRLVR